VKELKMLDSLFGSRYLIASIIVLIILRITLEFACTKRASFEDFKKWQKILIGISGLLLSIFMIIVFKLS
jgi:cytochrome b561